VVLTDSTEFAEDAGRLTRCPGEPLLAEWSSLPVGCEGVDVERFDEGLRCQDVHSGLRNVDPNSGSLTQLADTQLVGMAASLAALVRGQDVIGDAQALRAIAAEQLDVNQFAFDQVIALLAEVEFVSIHGWARPACSWAADRRG
jgi:hypothetical protein